jgi:PilZ domain
MSAPVPTPHDLLGRFLDMIPPLPTSINVFAPLGGVDELMLATVDGGQLVGYGPQDFMHATEITAHLRDDSGSGFDVVFGVARAYFQAGDQALIHMDVVDIVPRSGERETPRARLAELAHAVVRFSESVPAGEEFEVRLADLSEHGVAFVTDVVPSVGDRLGLAIDLDGRRIEVETLVAHVDPAPFGRNRVGCELTVRDPADRDLIGTLADDESSSSADDRRPELKTALWRSRAGWSALQQRLNPRRYSS